MIDTLHKTGCYFSTLIFFNSLHLLKMKVDQSVLFMFWSTGIKLNNIKSFIIGAEILIGIVYTIVLFLKNDDKHGDETGKEYRVYEVKNETERTYLGKFSLLILTSLSLPTSNNIWSLIIYFAVQILLMFIFIYGNLIYVNPILTMAKYKVYRCSCILQDNKGGIKEPDELVIISYRQLKKDCIFNIRNTNNKLIKLGNKNETDN